MQKIIISTLSIAATLILMTAPVNADDNTDKVVAKMAESDVSSTCKGGREAITSAATAATKTLAKTGKISGDFGAIGKAAGSQFYKEKCS